MNKPRYILTAALAAFCLAASSFAATGDIPYSQQGTNGQNVGHVWNGTGFVYVNSGGGTSSVSTNVLTNNGSGTLTTLTVSSNATVNSLQVGTDLSGGGTLSFTDSSGSRLTSITAYYGQVMLPAVGIGAACINNDGSAVFGGGIYWANRVSIDALGNLMVGGSLLTVSNNLVVNGAGTLTTLTVSSNATVKSLQVGTDLNAPSTLYFTDGSGSTLTSISAYYGLLVLPQVNIGNTYIYSDGSAVFGAGPGLAIDSHGNLDVNGASTLTQIVIPPTGGNSGTVTLLAGSAVYTNTATITESCVVIVSMKTPSGTPGIYAPLAHAGTGTISFSGLPTDNSTYNWAIINCTNN